MQLAFGLAHETWLFLCEGAKGCFLLQDKDFFALAESFLHTVVFLQGKHSFSGFGFLFLFKNLALDALVLGTLHVLCCLTF